MVINANELTETLDEIENELVNLDYIKTLLTQASYDVQYNFGDGNDDEHTQELMLIRRTPFIRNFIGIALDYVEKTTDELRDVIKHGYKRMGVNV